MLQAKLADGRLITPATISKKDRQNLKQRSPVFYCPVCNEKVILRAGQKVIAHFAHQSESRCPSTGGGEGAYHEQGKLRLYQWLRSQSIPVELEVYIKEIQQRPDFLIILHDKKIAVEYQCSKIPASQIIKRTKGYNKAGIHVIWVLGEKLLKRKTASMIKIDTFSQTFIHQFSSVYPPTLFYFCPQTLKFIKIQDLYMTGNNRAIGKFEIYPLKEMVFSDLFSKALFSKEELLKIWLQEKRRFRVQPRARQFGAELQWQQWLYLNKLHYERLPAIIHLPVRGAFRINTANWNWQSRLIFNFIAPLEAEAEFTLYQCIFFLRKNMISEDNFPLIDSGIHPIQEYLHILTELDYLEQTTNHTFKKTKAIHVHPHIEAAIEEDEKLIKQLFTKNQTKYEHDRSLFRYTK